VEVEVSSSDPQMSVAREWKVRLPEVRQAEASDSQLTALQQTTGLSRIALRVCLARGLDTAEAIHAFLNPTFEQLKSPLCIRDMEKATERLSIARASQERAAEKIRVYGDYDVDGTTGTALLSWVFTEFKGFDFDARQPDRFKDGYGLNVKAVEEAAADGVRILVTVDCGITSFDAAEKARELGIDLIVVDHHQVDAKRGLPPAHAILNPQRSDCESGLKQLCGCGLAFYLAMGLRIRGRAEKWWPEGAEPNLKQHLDLVVMATAADMVPLTGDNHVLVRHGLEVLKSTRKPGVKAMIEAAGLGSKDISPGHLGFVIGPRINASGRMQTASIALELLTTQDASRAFRLAREIETLNTERAALQNKIWDQVRERVEQGIAQGKFKHGIVVADAAWHEGVVGIVASRVTETFRRPAAVIALREDYGKGSVRSWAGKDVLAALRESAPTLRTFGGHKHAAGLSVENDQVEAFAAAFDRALGAIETDASALPLLIEGSALVEELNVRALSEIERLGPFGPGNPEPVFSVRAVVRSHQVLKGRHLKLNLAGAASAAQAGTLEAIWFHGAERSERVMQRLSEETEWAGVPELNRFRGNTKPSFRVKDWRPLS
jgi:single-stranded-DNA-specific exonuclease